MHGFTSFAAKHVCLGSVKRATYTEFVAKSRLNYSLLSATNFHNLHQPELLEHKFEHRYSTRFAAKVAKRVTRFCCLPVFLYL